MQYFIKRVTSAVVAGAVVFGSIAFYPDSKTDTVRAATLYDSASLVNYEIILGRATDYGIVSKSFTQNSHMETTLATSSFSRARGNDDSIDVDLTSSPTAQFIIGEITPANGFIAFGPVKHSDQSIDVKNVNVVFPDSPDFNVTNKVQLRMNVADQTTFNYSYISKEKIDNNINSVIGHGKDEADKISTKTGNSDYVLDVTKPGVLDVNGSVTTIDLSDPIYKNRVVYIDMSPVKQEPGQPEKPDPFRNLREVWTSDPGGNHLLVKKNSSTVVVFTNNEKARVVLGKIKVDVVDSDYVDTPPLNAPNDAYCSTTDHSGYMSQHNSFVDREIAQKFIWNIPEAKDVLLTGSAGTFLLNGDNVKVLLDNSPSAGWIVANGNVENKCEFHYIYGGASTDISTEGNGQMHFALHKNFASAYKTKAELENGSSFVDTSIDIEKDQYSFVLQEYTDETFATTYGPAIPRSVGTDSILEFPTISFTADDSGTEHYAVKKDSSGASYKDFYFRVKENPNSVYSIANNAGRIDIRLRVTSNDAGTISFAVQSKTYIGDSEDSLILYAENGTFGSKDKWVDMVGPRFDLGAFYNKVLVPGYMTLSKTISDNVSEEDLKDITFTVTDGKDFSVEYKLGRDFTKNPTTGVYELTTPLTVPDAQTTYTVTETLYSLDGYKLEEVSYKVDGGETQHDNDTASLDSVSTDSNNPTTVAYTDSYTPLGTLKVHKTAVDNNNNNINYYYEFSVKKGENQYLQADKQSFDSTEYYFTIGTNEEQVFENIPVGIYTITEKTDELFVYGYTFEKEISKISGTADVAKKSTVDFTLENKFTQDLGNLKVTKAAEDNNGNVVEGTFKFTISTPMRGFLQADGSFGNSKHYFTIRTGQTLTFENLPVDNYMITEDTDSINVTGYTFNMADSKYSVLGKVTKNGNTNVILENDFTQDVGTLKVIKTAKDNHDTNVSGTFEFSVKNSKNQFLQADKKTFDSSEVFFTVEAGSFTAFENIPVGSYTVEENTGSISVDGFTFTTEGSTTSVVADVKKNETADAGLFNNFIQDLGTLTVAKVATDDNDKNVNGSFQFSVKNSAGKFLQSDEETFTNTEYFFTVEAGSSKTFTDLPVGEYTISEKTNGVSVPGYTYLVNDSTTKGTGTVSKVTTANSTVTLENKFEQDVGSLTVSKTAKDDNNENVSGSFKFSVKNSAGLYLQSDKKTFDTEVYFFTVAAGSTAVFNNLPVGVYTVTEDANSVAVTGYTFISSRIPEVEAEVEKNESVTAELVNNYEKDVGNLVVSKTAKDNNDKSVAGSFKFSVKNSAGLYLQSDKKTFDTAEYFFTVASGSTAEFNNLPVGVYTVTEDPDSVGVTGYTFESGSTTHVEAEVVKNDSVTAGLVNNYTQDTGSLTVKKSAIDNYDNTVNGTFKFSVKNSDDKFLQEDEKSFEDEAFFFTVAAGSSKTFENLPVGTYSVNEDTGSVSVTGYTFNENDSKTYAEARVVKDGNADAELENKFTLDLGSLKITKALGEGYPEEARTKAYNFIINGPDDYSEMRTVTGADSVIITGLKPGKYTVTEDTNDAKIEGYDLEVTGGGEVTVVGKAEAATTITNTYTLQTGSLKITKALGDNAPEEAALKTYSFTITGPNNYSKTVSVDGAGYVIVEDLVPGTYTVTENTEGAAIEGYDLEVTGGGEVNVVAKATALTTVTNTYKLQLGFLKITKELGANAPESAARKSYTFVITGPDNYSKEVAIIGAGSVTVENLVPGAYTVAEVEDGAVIADYDLEVTGGGEVTVAAKATAETTITNTYTQQKGSLKITKDLGANAPADAASKSYTFTVTGPDNYSETVTIEGAGSKTLTDLVPGTYTVTENETDAAIDGYDLEVTGGGEVTVAAKATAETTITNTYTQQLGSLKITKALGANAPESATSKTYTFTVTGPNNYSKTVTIEGAGEEKIEGLVPGTYTVTEDADDAAIDGYDLEVTGGGEVNVVAKDTAETTVTNTYTLQTGSLKIFKTLGADAPESAKTKSYSFVITGPNEYSKEVAVIGTGSVTVDNLVPGSYTVTEVESGAAIADYDLEVTGGGEVTVAAKATAETTVTNTYTKQTGSLTVSKIATDNNGDDVNETFYFSVKNSEGQYLQNDRKSFGASEVFFEVTAGGTEEFTDLPVGVYTISEDTTRVEVTGYDFLTTSTTETSARVTKSTTAATATLENKYEKHLGTLTVQKNALDNNNEDVDGTFEFSVKNGEGKYLQRDEQTFADTVFFFTVDAGASKTFENLPAGKYNVEENTANISVTGYTFDLDESTTIGTGTVSKTSSEHSTVTLENKFTKDVGSLKITKALGANAPADAASKSYTFTVTGPDNYSETVTIEGAGSKTLTDLVPGTYTVTENETDAAITGYDLEVTGGGEVAVAAKATAETTVTNTYTHQKGTLKITKVLGENAPASAGNKEYTFTITGPDNYSKTVTIKGADSVTIDDLEPGNYTVTEDKDGAKIDNYELTVTGDDGKTIEVKAGETADAAITNTYEENTTSDKGSLKITKKLGANAPQAASSKEYKFTVTGPDNYSKTVTIKGADSVTIDDLEPGNYTVTEDKDGAKIDNYELTVTGDDGKTIEVKAGETANAEITNTYDDNTMSDKGSLKISKTLGDNAPSAASDKSFTFTVTGPDNYTKTVTIKGTGSVTIDDLEPGNYTVTEDEEGAAITNYKLTVTGDNGNAIEVKAGKTANAAITNTYKDSSLSEVGSLKITKALGSGAPSAASNKEFKFTVTGPDNYSKTVTIKGAGSYTIRDLTPGSYKVTEDKASANIENYDLEVTGGGTVEVKAGQTTESTVTNTYKDNSTTVDTGSLTVSKLALDMSEDPITGSFKFSVKNSEGKYLQQNEKDFGTSIYLFTINGGESKKFTGLPVGSYTVEEDISDMSVEGNYVLVVDQSATSVTDNVTKNGNTEVKLINMFEEGGVPTPAPTGAVTVTKKVAGDTSVAASSYKFYVKCGDQYVQDDSTGALGSDKHAFTVDPSSEGTTITGLTLGKTYVIEEESVSAPSGYTCAVTYTESNTVVLDKDNKTGSVKITNTYIDTSKPDDSGNETGSLKVTKKVTGSTASSGMPSEYKFTVSYIDGDETLYVQDTAGATGSEKHEFTVSADSSVVIKGLALDVEYKVEEVKVTGIPSDYSCKTSYSDGGTITLDSSSATETVVITNNYSYKAPEPEPTTGSLTITKGLNSGAPSAAKNKTYTFKVTGNGETRTVTIKGANSKTIHDLVPGTYTVSEEKDGISIAKYNVTVTGEGNVTIEAGKTAKIKITNTYEDVTGSLKITKALASGAPDAAENKTYKFTVTGPDGYSESVEIKGSGSKTLTGLMPGSYKVIENEADAAIDGYNLKVSGDNSSVSVQTGKTASVTVTNSYEQKMGTLCFTKTFGGDVTESEANGGDLYFIIENTDTSIEARYLKPDGTFTADKSEAHITLAHLEKTTATNGKFAFKKNFTVPVGNYKVTEENTNVYFRGTSEPITMANSSVTSSVADITDGNTTDVELSDVYELNDNLKVTFNKEDEAHNLIAQAQLTLKSVDGYDLSNVKVTQGGTQVAVTLSADKSSISFYTVDTAPSIVSGLKAGDYELTETVTPPKYKTADAIRFTLYPDGNTKRVGDVTVSGSPIVMIDKADPNYHQGGNNPPIPATGEMTSATTMIGAALMVLAAACFTGLYIFRTKKKEEN